MGPARSSRPARRSMALVSTPGRRTPRRSSCTCVTTRTRPPTSSIHTAVHGRPRHGPRTTTSIGSASRPSKPLLHRLRRGTAAAQPFRARGYDPRVTQSPAPVPDASARPRPIRRGPAELPFRFPDRGLAQALAAEREEPGWLRAERIQAWKAYEALPVEANQLYTPYIDLRGASLEEVRPYVNDGPPSLGDDLAALPNLARGVHVETFGHWLERYPDAFKSAIEGGAGLPADDKLAMLARGFWCHGRQVE